MGLACQNVHWAHKGSMLLLQHAAHKKEGLPGERTLSATKRPASTPSAFARNVAVACVDSGMLHNHDILCNQSNDV